MHEAPPSPMPAAAIPAIPPSPLGHIRAELRDLVRCLGAPEGGAGPSLRPDQPSRSEIIRRVRTDASLRREPGRPAVAVFAGPPGSGKTSAAIKVASRLMLQGQPPPIFIAPDTRIGSGEPLRSYAAALEAPFLQAATAEETMRAIDRASPSDIVFIDTPGLARRDSVGAEMLAALRERVPRADLFLVLSAAAKAADLSHAVERFERFRPTKLLFTRLDETSTYGPLWSEAVRWNLPVSFLAFGPGIPEDIEAATAVRLADLALNPGHRWIEARRKNAAVSAAAAA